MRPINHPTAATIFVPMVFVFPEIFQAIAKQPCRAAAWAVFCHTGLMKKQKPNRPWAFVIDCAVILVVVQIDSSHPATGYPVPSECAFLLGLNPTSLRPVPSQKIGCREGPRRPKNLRPFVIAHYFFIGWQNCVASVTQELGNQALASPAKFEVFRKAHGRTTIKPNRPNCCAN